MTGFSCGLSMRAALIAICSSLVLPMAATAQIEEIVVTARKKEESLQDVPISISAFGAEQLDQQGLLNDNDVANFTVNFNTLPTTGRDYDRPTIRGMAAPTSRGEANASYFIDGIYVSTSIGSATTSAVERVEILRGPQSAQFGRATFSGAINYVTKAPTNEFAGRVKSRAGTHDDYEVGGWVSGPIVEDRLLFLLSGSWSSYGGEWHNNLQDNQATPTGFLQNPPQQGDHSRLGTEETQDYLAKLVWRPWDSGEFNFKYGYNETDDSMWPSVVAPGGPDGVYATLNCWLPPEGRSPLPPGAPAPDEEPWWRTSGGSICGKLNGNGWENRVNLPDMNNGVTTSSGVFVEPAEPGLRKTVNRYLAEYRQELGDWMLTYRGGANTEDFANGFDLDHTETRAVFGLFNFDFLKDSRDWSSELRLASPADLPVRGEIGAFYFDRHLTSTQRSIPGPGTILTGNTAFPPRAERDVTNVAWIGTLGWDIADLWQLDLEGRYASEDVEFIGGNRCQSKETYYNFTPRVSLTFKPTDELRFYVQAANGDKPGDVNSEFFRGDVDKEFCEQVQLNTTDATIKPEEQWTYEIGAKTQWWDRRIQANLAIFWIEWSEQSIFQVQNFGAYDFPDYNNTEDLVTTILRNVGDSRNYGGELETLFVLTDELTLIANYGYTRAKFRKGYDADLFNLTGDGDVDGKWIPSAPEHSLVLGAVVNKPVSADWSLLFRTDLAYESKRYTGTSNFNWLDDRTLVNLRVGMNSERWDISAYVRNLMEDDTPVAALNFVNFGYGPIAPGVDQVYNTNDDVYPNMYSLNPQRGRDYGVEVQYKFGAQ